MVSLCFPHLPLYLDSEIQNVIDLKLSKLKFIAAPVYSSQNNNKFSSPIQKNNIYFVMKGFFFVYCQSSVQ